MKDLQELYLLTENKFLRSSVDFIFRKISLMERVKFLYRLFFTNKIQRTSLEVLFFDSRVQRVQGIEEIYSFLLEKKAEVYFLKNSKANFRENFILLEGGIIRGIKVKTSYPNGSYH